MHAASAWVPLQSRVLPRRVVCELRQHAVVEVEGLGNPLIRMGFASDERSPPKALNCSERFQVCEAAGK